MKVLHQHREEVRTIKEIQLKGMIVSDSAKERYKAMKMEVTTPNDIISQLDGDEPVRIIVNSIGGCVQSGSSIYTALKKYKGNIESEIIFAASIATVIAMASDKIVMSPTGQFMIHNVSTKTEGDYRDMEKSAQALKNMNAMIASAYKGRVKVDESKLKDMMDAETWMNAETAKELGFIDEIMFENKSQSYVACFTNNMSFEGGENVTEEVKGISNEDFEAFKKEMLDLVKTFKNADQDTPAIENETDEERLTRRIDQLEKLKEDGNSLSDAERVELIDDLLALVRANREASSTDTDGDNDPQNSDGKEKSFENKTKRVGLFL